MNSARFRGLAFFIRGSAMLWAAIVATELRFAAIFIGLTFFLLGANSLGPASRHAASLMAFRNRPVRVKVWGAAVPMAVGSTIVVDSVKAFGAGLLIHLRESSGSQRTLLKVAQPGSARLEERRFEVDHARYVAWGGTRLTAVPGQSALTIVLTSG